jgi:hypothetical protein
LDIVEKVEDTAREISLKEAKKNNPKNPDLKIGQKVFEELPQIDFDLFLNQDFLDYFFLLLLGIFLLQCLRLFQLYPKLFVFLFHRFLNR